MRIGLTHYALRITHYALEEVLNQEQIVQPITKYTWLARRPDMIPETIRRAFKAAWTPPYGPSYISWHSDYNDERVRTEIIPQDQVDPRMRVRPNPEDVQRAAKLLVYRHHHFHQFSLHTNPGRVSGHQRT